MASMKTAAVPAENRGAADRMRQENVSKHMRAIIEICTAG